MKEIVFTIGGGEVKIEANGFKGSACEAATKVFEEALGGSVKNKTRKAEYHQTAAVAATVKVGGPK